VQFLDPTSPNPRKALDARVLKELKGKRLAYLNNGWTSMTKIGLQIEAPLKTTYGVSEIVVFDVPRNTEPPGGLLDRVAREFDGAIVGMAN
jgi:hypothetical protein